MSSPEGSTVTFRRVPEALARPAESSERADRTGSAMMAAVILATWIAIPLLGLVSFVQLLYLESTRLRTRDLPSLKFFKVTLEDKLGMKTEQGAASFSM